MQQQLVPRPCDQSCARRSEPWAQAYQSGMEKTPGGAPIPTLAPALLPHCQRLGGLAGGRASQSGLWLIDATCTVQVLSRAMYGYASLGLLAAALATSLSLAGEPAPASRSALPDAATLQAAHARVGTITIRPHQIFDLDDPHENGVLYRLADRLHVRSHQAAIRAQLLFHSGDAYDARLLEETERNLRQLPYIREPKVRAIAWHDGVVDIDVDTYDVWTLQFGPSFSRAGGANSTNIGVADDNILGYGKQLGIGWSSTVDRTGTYFAWNDPNVLGSHWTDTAVWLTNSDGYSHGMQLILPFYQLASTHSYGLVLSDTVETDTRYRFGLAYDSYQHDIHATNIYAGWSTGLVDGRSWRLSAGVQAQNDEFATLPGDTLLGPLPANRNLVYPYVSLALVTDQFVVTQNANHIARTEDFQFGWNGNLQLGWSSPALGADRSAGIINGQLSYGARPFTNVGNFATLTYSTRLQNGQLVDEHTGAQDTFYWRTSGRTLFYVLLSGDTGRNDDLDHYDLLGGDSGLRGYPLRYQMGTSRSLETVEERIYTPWSLWHLLDIGGAAFYDIGRTWGPNLVNEPELGWLSDAGIGLRLGNNRSSLGNVIHVDLATPLNSGNPNLRGLQLLVSTQATY
jgi:hypothetical protein